MAHTIVAEMVASVLTVSVDVGDRVDAGAVLMIMESMKMEIPVLSETSGVVSEVFVHVGDVVQEGDVLMSLAN